MKTNLGKGLKWIQIKITLTQRPASATEVKFGSYSTSNIIKYLINLKKPDEFSNIGITRLHNKNDLNENLGNS